MLNQYVNMSPQQRMAQMLQQQQQPTQLQGQQNIPQQESPFANMSGLMGMYKQYQRQQQLANMQNQQGGAGIQNPMDMSAQSMPVSGGSAIPAMGLGG